jgi:hypothetical protein
MSRQILKSGVSCSFSQFFDLPFTIEDILAEFGCTIDRTAINLPRKTLDRPLDNLRHELVFGAGATSGAGEVLVGILA